MELTLLLPMKVELEVLCTRTKVKMHFSRASFEELETTQSCGSSRTGIDTVNECWLQEAPESLPIEDFKFCTTMVSSNDKVTCSLLSRLYWILAVLIKTKTKTIQYVLWAKTTLSYCCQCFVSVWWHPCLSQSCWVLVKGGRSSLSLSVTLSLRVEEVTSLSICRCKWVNFSMCQRDVNTNYQSRTVKNR